MAKGVFADGGNTFGQGDRSKLVAKIEKVVINGRNFWGKGNRSEFATT